ncbi:unnamed protein product [Schistocephalus solidus]|uniref:39S ribosomal protein L17, mitochondrial n=1 Tax=Schistocephalus solidus TaxID=70667 RepID=A0A183TP14_SCHSO|nr:unnamed protein product [Schistocephalus solidus]
MHNTSTIQHIFGRQTLALTRSWEKFSQREAATLEQLSFLHRCRDHGILSKSLRFKPTLSNEAGRLLARKYGFRVLSAIIADVHNRLCQFEAIVSDLERLQPVGTHIPRLYGLPKIYKEGLPVHPILDMHNSPYHAIAKWLAEKLKPIQRQLAPRSYRDKYEFIDDVKDINLNGDALFRRLIAFYKRAGH